MALLLLVGVVGLVVGSFLNVVIYRVPKGESLLKPRSHCPACLIPIRARHNVPLLSWLRLRGKCARCNASISPRYPLVEAGTAGLFMVVTARFGLVPQLPAYLYLSAIGIALAVIDLDVKRLPNRIVLPSYGVGAVLLAGADLLTGHWSAALRALLAMLALLALFTAMALAWPGGMGMGDVKLAGLLGLFLGWLSWGSVLVGAFAGFALGAIVGIGLVATRRAGRRSAVPFGPFLLTGALLALLVADPVMAWYGSLLTGGI